MALKYNVGFTNTAKVGLKEIKFKPWTTKNEKDYLIAVESEENITDDMLYNILVRPCLEEPDIILSSNEQKMLMIEIRKKSLGTSFPMRFSCKKCKQVNDIDVSFDKIVKFSPENWHDVQVEDIKFVFGSVVSENLRKKEEECTTNIDKSFINMLIHIKEIHINDEVENTFTFQELKDFVEELPSTIFDTVYKEFLEMKSSLTFEFKTNCMICGDSNDIDFSYLPNFLWM